MKGWKELQRDEQRTLLYLIRLWLEETPDMVPPGETVDTTLESILYLMKRGFLVGELYPIDQKEEEFIFQVVRTKEGDNMIAASN